MTQSNIQRLVSSERENLLEENDNIKDAVVTRPHRGQTVAVGLLALNEIDAAKMWFRALAEEWVIYADNKWKENYKENPRSPASPGPWSDYIEGLFAALLGRHDVDGIADTIYNRTDSSFVDNLSKREFAHRIDLARSLSGLILGKTSVGRHLDMLEQYVASNGNEWDEARYSAYISFIQALISDTKPEVLDGLKKLLSFHHNHVASAPDADAVQKAVALDATAMLALARREGLAITVEHDAIPDALNDDEHYPIGGVE
jgi:hypothetical protein